jgi:hypothetical protein
MGEQIEVEDRPTHVTEAGVEPKPVATGEHAETQTRGLKFSAKRLCHSLIATLLEGFSSWDFLKLARIYKADQGHRRAAYTGDLPFCLADHPCPFERHAGLFYAIRRFK